MLPLTLKAHCYRPAVVSDNPREDVGAQGAGGGRCHFKGRWPRHVGRFGGLLGCAAIAVAMPPLYAQSLQSEREPVVVSPWPKLDSGVLFPTTLCAITVRER